MMKTLYIASCLMFLLAVVCNLAAKHEYSGALRVRAVAVGIGGAAAMPVQAEGGRLVVQGERIEVVGWVAVACAIVLWGGAWMVGRKQGKCLTPLVPVVLLVAYGLVAVLAV